MSRNNLLNAFVPKYYTLFPYLEKCGDNLIFASGQLKLLMRTTSPEKQSEIVKQISNSERIAEKLKESTYSILNKLIVLPFDREDINKLVNRSDDLIDSIDEISRIIKFNKHTEIFASYVEMSNMIGEAALEIAGCFKELKDLDGNKNRMNKSCSTLTRLYKDTEDIYYEGILDIFSKNNDAVQLTIRKKLFETFMECNRGIKDITEAIRTILIKVM